MKKLFLICLAVFIILLLFMVKTAFSAEDWHTPGSVDSSCEPGGDAGDLIDGDIGTSWTHYVVHSHWVILDMGETYAISKMQIYDGWGWGNSNDIIEIYVTDNLEELGASVGSFEFPNEAGGVWIEFDVTDKSGRYIKLVSEIKDACAWYEFQIYGEVSGAPPVPEEAQSQIMMWGE